MRRYPTSAGLLQRAVARAVGLARASVRRLAQTLESAILLIRLTARRPEKKSPPQPRASRECCCELNPQKEWYAWQGSNLRPVAPEATALSI